MQLFTLDNVALEFTPDALKAVAKKTMELNTGARGLRSVMEGLLTNLMFEVPSDYTIEKVIIHEDYVEGKGKPELVINRIASRPSRSFRRKAVPPSGRLPRNPAIKNTMTMGSDVGCRLAFVSAPLFFL